MEDYLQILEESLHKKLQVLKKIEEINVCQEKILRQETVNIEEFDQTVDQKSVLIEALNQLDYGFENIYSKVREQLLQNRERYKNQIEKLQGLVKAVTEKGITIQAQEARNKMLVESFFGIKKKELQSRRYTSKASLDYYRNMNKTSFVTPQFLDKKK